MTIEEALAAVEATKRLLNQADFRALAPLISEWMVFKWAEESGTIPPLEVLRQLKDGA